MKDFEEIGKRMPYAEEPEYIQSMIDSQVEKVIRKQNSINRSVFVRRIIICTASAAALFGMFFLADLFVKNEVDSFAVDTGSAVQAKAEIKDKPMEGLLAAEIKSSKTLDEVLASMNDAQIEDLVDYSLDDIPDYYSEEY